MRLACVLATSVGIVAFGNAATAADLPIAPPAPAPAFVPPPLSWTGFYLGLDGGYGWGSHDRVTHPVAPPLFANSYNSDGWLFGGHLGYNYQIGQFVVGVEGDAHWADIQGDDGGVGGTLDRTKIEFLASIRGRLGVVAFDRALLFVTGGWAFASAKHHNPAGVPASNSVDLDGWTLGGGVQFAFAPNWSAGLEYRYYDLGSYTLSPAGPLFPFTVDSKINTVTGRISYKFDGF